MVGECAWRGDERSGGHGGEPGRCSAHCDTEGNIYSYSGVERSLKHDQCYPLNVTIIAVGFMASDDVVLTYNCKYADAGPIRAECPEKVTV